MFGFIALERESKTANDDNDDIEFICSDREKAQKWLGLFQGSHSLVTDIAADDKGDDDNGEMSGVMRSRNSIWLFYCKNVDGKSVHTDDSTVKWVTIGLELNRLQKSVDTAVCEDGIRENEIIDQMKSFIASVITCISTHGFH